MTVIELSDEQAEALTSRAHRESLTLKDWLAKMAREEIAMTPDQPFETGYGSWAKYGAAPSAEEIDENRADMLGGFAKEI